MFRIVRIPSMGYPPWVTIFSSLEASFAWQKLSLSEFLKIIRFYLKQIFHCSKKKYSFLMSKEVVTLFGW